MLTRMLGRSQQAGQSDYARPFCFSLPLTLLPNPDTLPLPPSAVPLRLVKNRALMGLAGVQSRGLQRTRMGGRGSFLPILIISASVLVRAVEIPDEFLEFQHRAATHLHPAQPLAKRPMTTQPWTAYENPLL